MIEFLFGLVLLGVCPIVAANAIYEKLKRREHQLWGISAFEWCSYAYMVTAGVAGYIFMVIKTIVDHYSN